MRSQRDRFLLPLLFAMGAADNKFGYFQTEKPKRKSLRIKRTKTKKQLKLRLKAKMARKARKNK